MSKVKLNLSLLRDERGGVLLELALALPLMVSLIFGGLEVTRFLLTTHQISRVAMSTADLVSQAKEIREADVANVFLASGAIMGDDTISELGDVILSSVTRTGGDAPIVAWQRRMSNSHEGASRIGTEGNAAQLPAEIVLLPGDGVIVAEVYYAHEPLIFDDIVGAQDIYEVAYYRPRFGAVGEVLPNP